MELIIVLFYMIVLTAMHLRSVKKSRAERDELHRWRTCWEEQRRWLAEFPDVVAALEHLSAYADGRGVANIADLRDVMRIRSDSRDLRYALVQHSAYTPEERQAAEDFGIVIEPRGSAITSKRMPL